MTLSNDEFYVGYLPMPAGHRRFVGVALAVLIVLIVGSAALIASQQRDPGSAKWDLATRTTFEGVIHARPYPMLDVGDTSLLLVLEGKRGALPRLSAYEGQYVRIAGHVLERGVGRLLEVTDEAIAVLDAGAARPAPRRGDAADVTLRGEIIDPKCYSGAMKPGEGKTHKACAVLCLRGGIPPMFIVHDRSDAGKSYLLVDADGRELVGDALESVVPYVGDAVEVRGRAVQHGDLWLLHVEDVIRL